jgi:hypothetical protein
MKQLRCMLQHHDDLNRWQLQQNPLFRLITLTTAGTDSFLLPIFEPFSLNPDSTGQLEGSQEIDSAREVNDKKMMTKRGKERALETKQWAIRKVG